MPEKTLKEKVEAAKKCLDEQLDSLEQHKYGVVAVRKALTALEDQLTWTDGMLEKALEKIVYLEQMLSIRDKQVAELAPRFTEEDREKLRKIEQEIKEIQTMANNTDIVKEIDCCIDLISDTRNKISREIILSTLQRARDALRWKPIDENTPYDTILLFMSHSGNVRQDFIYDEGLERAQKQYIGWMEIPAYTPEEK